jgi:hypothetical protein
VSKDLSRHVYGPADGVRLSQMMHTLAAAYGAQAVANAAAEATDGRYRGRDPSVTGADPHLNIADAPNLDAFLRYVFPQLYVGPT